MLFASIQPCLNHLSSLPVVIMLGSDKVELMQTTFNIMLNIMLNIMFGSVDVEHHVDLVVIMLGSDMVEQMIECCLHQFNLV